MSSTLQARGQRPARLGDAPRALWVVYGVLATLLVAYLGSLILRGPDGAMPLLDGWLVGIFEVVASALCLARGFALRRGRALPLALGCAVMFWGLGDLVVTAQAASGATGNGPSVADIFYLSFYPLTYGGLAMLMRRHLRTLAPSMWLDGAVAGLGAAGVCASFAFNAILHSVGGDAATVATNLAYPIGDLLLLAIAVGGTAILPVRRNPQWLLLAGACALNVVGDTFHLFELAGPPTHLGFIFDGIAWPTSILLISMSVWLRSNQANPISPQRTAGFLLPGLGAGAGLVILFVGTLVPVRPVALGLATATLLAVGVRLGTSVRRLRLLTEKRHRQALTDELTGLANRRQLFYLLGTFFADAADTRIERHVSLLFIDLDHFKEINDSFGHAAGDELLRQLGPRLASTLRESDVLVRVGGDELAVVILDADAGYASAVARRLIDKLEEPFLLNSVSVRISASIGIATAPTDATDSAGLLRCADLAMYRAKIGASGYETYRYELDDGGNRLRLVEELRDAVHNGMFEVHYQPQVELRSGVVSGVEALLRWPHPRVGLVPPLDFLPLAEEAGLMRAVTAFVLEQALAQCAAWHAQGHSMTVSVNVSVTDILDAGFVDSVATALALHRVPPSLLILEITETTIIGDFAACKTVIAALRALGLGVSIDDFGAGFTSLASLGALAVNELKLDRTFITGLARGDQRDLALVSATIELGHALAMRVVAEGVEEASILELLTRIGCDSAQGYHIGRPVLPADLLLDEPRHAVLVPMAAAR